ncbi:hypothetical protein NMY22_g9523 [Coprinellus aureogranulatus]|nr:hypothetical protein NMY22_g9523 [Coprinellus aureogranulatus]
MDTGRDAPHTPTSRGRNDALTIVDTPPSRPRIPAMEKSVDDTRTSTGFHKQPSTSRQGICLVPSKIAPFRSEIVSVNPPSGTVIKTKRWWSFSLRRFGRKAAVLANVGASIAEAVPVLGAPVKGTLEASIKVQTILEQKRCQNVEAVQQLVHKLKCLEQQLCRHSKSTLDEWLIQRLDETEHALQRLAAENGLDYEFVASSITQCERDITFFMGQLSLGAAKEGMGALEEIKRQNEDIKREIQAMRQNEANTVKSLQALMANQAGGHGPTLLSFGIWVVDPWGVQHPLSRIPWNFDVLAKEMLFRYARDERRGPVLERYLRHNLFEISRESGREVRLVTEQDLMTLDKDSTLVMSIITFTGIAVEGMQCPLCKNYIAISIRGAESVYCRTCNKSLQVGREDEAKHKHARYLEGDDSLADMRQLAIKTRLASSGAVELNGELTDGIDELQGYQPPGMVTIEDPLLLQGKVPSETREKKPKSQPTVPTELQPAQRGAGSSNVHYSNTVEEPRNISWTEGYLQMLGRSTPKAKLLGVLPFFKVSTIPSHQPTLRSKWTMQTQIIPSSRIELVSTGITDAPRPVPKSFAAGGYADIYTATMTMDDGTEKSVAVKVFRGAHVRSDKVSPEVHKNVGAPSLMRSTINPSLKRLRREYSIWQRLHHPNVQALRGLFVSDALPSPGLVSDYKPLGDLRDFCKRKIPFDRLAMAQGIANGLQYLHSKKVVHGELKPADILVDQSEDGKTYIPLITDFGKARIDGHDGYTADLNFCFVAERPPELLGHKYPELATNEEVLSFASDVYSFSMVLLWLLTDIEPYRRDDMRILGFPGLIIDEKKPLRPCPEKYPLLDESHAFCWPIMEACWKHVPAERISSKKAYELLCQGSALKSSFPIAK